MSMVYLGEAYSRGKKNEESLLQAVKWYKPAAEAGFAPAEHLLARVYLKLRDTESAVRYFSEAAAKDYPPSIYRLGCLYLVGFGVERNPQKAVELLERAMSLGHIPAKGLLAKYLITRDKRPGQIVRGLWLGLCVRVQFFAVLIGEGLRSERFRM